MKRNLKDICICFVGNMLGRNANNITTQGQIVSDLFEADGYDVICVSSKINRVLRLLDIVQTLIRRSREIDIVLLDSYSGLNFVSSEVTGILCKLFRIPLVMVLRGGNFPVFTKKYPRWSRRVFNRANALVAPSAFLAREVGEHGYNIPVISNVIDISLYPFVERNEIAPALIWMRSFHPIYYPEMALKVLYELRKRGRDATLIMAGKDKGLESGLRTLAEELDLSEHVEFAGFLDRNAKLREFAKANIFLNTNRIDNMPVAVVEARALGLPVVATEVGGLPYLINHKVDGLLVPDEDVEAMVENIEMLLDDPELTRKISTNGRRLAEDSAWTKVKGEWEELISKVLTEVPSRRVASGNVEEKLVAKRAPSEE